MGGCDLETAGRAPRREILRLRLLPRRDGRVVVLAVGRPRIDLRRRWRHVEADLHHADERVEAVVQLDERLHRAGSLTTTAAAAEPTAGATAAASLDNAAEGCQFRVELLRLRADVTRLLHLRRELRADGGDLLVGGEGVLHPLVRELRQPGL